mmetsp:Transcript_21399/g.36764  ORF Transcript_21399/g.36764 Transcript_21399/m.36764 type:complete len:328 (+) Transcript_21399:156-1139(+)
MEEMVSEEVGLEVDPSSGSGHEVPQDLGSPQTQSTGVLEVASGSDDGHDIEEGIPPSPHKQPPQSLSQDVSRPHSTLRLRSSRVVSRSHSTLRASRPSVKECLKVPESEMADLSLDVYNMFYLSDIKSQACVYSSCVFLVKLSLYILLLLDLRTNKKVPTDGNMAASIYVKIAQQFLIPVAIVTQEELITSYFIFSHLKYSPEIRKRHPGAYYWKFILAHFARFADGVLFLFINVWVMLIQENDVLGLFLNFAALQFLQMIDNIALQVSLDGYWTRSLQEAAQDVVDMKFAYRHTYVHNCMQGVLVLAAWISMVVVWGVSHYKPKDE